MFEERQAVKKGENMMGVKLPCKCSLTTQL